MAGGALTPFQGLVWRLILPGQDPLAPAQATEGRFHHDGQWAVYTSLTPEGCHLAIARYRKAGGPPRELVQLRVQAPACADHRTDPAARIVWQDLPRPAPTWSVSDAARDQGAQGLIYASRSRPELTHLVLFSPEVLALP